MNAKNTAPKNFDDLLKKNNDGIMQGAILKASRDLGLSTTTISRYRLNISPPDEKRLVKMARFFNLSVEEMASYFQPRKKEPVLAPADVKVPIIAIISSEPFNIDLYNYKQLEEITVRTKEGDGKLLGLKVSGDWLSPVANDGDYIAISTTSEHKNRDLVLVRADAGYMFKWYVHAGKSSGLVHVSGKGGVSKVKDSDMTVAAVVRYFVNSPKCPVR